MTTTRQPPAPGHHRVAGFFTLLAGVVLAGGVVIGLTAGVGAVWTAVTSSGTASAATAAAAKPAGAPAVSHAATAPAATVEQVKLVVNPPPLYGVKGAGQIHDAFVPGTFTMKVGETYRVTVLNYDDMPHTWTSAGLGVNASIPAGSKSSPSRTTFTIHPAKAGTFSWYCATPCDQWSMVHNGYMRGHVEVTA